MPVIHCIDAIMGRGKTTFLLDHIKSVNDRERHARWEAAGDAPAPTKWMIVVPLLSEVDRFKAALLDLDLFDPQPIEGRKLHHLKTLVSAGRNIVCTHHLFSLLDAAIYADLKAQNYVLVIDEVLDAVDVFTGLSRDDRAMLFDKGHVSVDPATKRLIWNHNIPYRGKHEDIRGLCDTGSLVMVNETVLLWEFPSHFLHCFKEIWLATYQLFGSPFYSYLIAEGFHLNMKTVSPGGVLVDWLEGSDEAHLKARLRELIKLHEEPKANAIGEQKPGQNPLSASWFKRQPDSVLAKLSASTKHFFKEVAQTPAHLNGWTVWKDFRNRVKGERFSRNSSTPDKSYGFIPSNAKASNDWRRVESVAYLCNAFYHPTIRAYFEDRGVPVYEDLFALNQMLQWMWRSAIREGKPIHAFVPSERMRGLLKRWLNAASTVELVRETDPSNPYFKGMLIPDSRAIAAE